MKKGFRALLAEANAEIDVVSPAEARALLGDADTLFVDVREAQERVRGYIPGSIHAPRGFLEFIADPEGPMHNPDLASGRRLVVYCASGGRSTLAAKTLKDMGFDRVANLVGGIQAWAQAGGDLES
ncbi:MAG: rhodanese-like domain-containing protein [Kiloniellales bacterium]